jgi:hypothetical protein
MHLGQVFPSLAVFRLRIRTLPPLSFLRRRSFPARGIVALPHS